MIRKALDMNNNSFIYSNFLALNFRFYISDFDYQFLHILEIKYLISYNLRSVFSFKV